MRILLTGGAGYIGSHTSLELIKAGHEVVCYDNLSNSRADVMERLAEITGRSIPLVVGDIRDRRTLEAALTEYGAEAVIHFAGLKSVGESVKNPLSYYDNNVQGTLCLLEAMSACNVKVLAFSSSATVYGHPKYLPIDEEHPTSATNPYGRTKLMIEEMLSDLAIADPEWRIAVLRYFNPVGAHESGLIGEDPNGIPNNLMPYISRVASGRLPDVSVFGNNYETHDGTGVRDYIHVSDLADGHVSAINKLNVIRSGFKVWNLGTGRGYSVLSVIRAFESANGVSIPFKMVARRTGDVGTCYASAQKASVELDWRAKRDIWEMCRTAWIFESNVSGVPSPRPQLLDAGGLIDRPSTSSGHGGGAGTP